MSDIKPEVQELLQKRIKIYRDTIAFNNPERIPYTANNFTWKFLDAGYTVAEAARDYDKIEKTVDHFLGSYNVDQLMDLGFRNPFRLTDALGGSQGYIDSNPSELNALDKEYFSADDYDAIMENYPKALWEKALFNKFPSAKNMTPKQFAEASKELLLFNQAYENMRQKARNEYGVPAYNGGYVFIFFEFLFNYYRGIKGISRDIRRDPGKLEAVCKQMDELFVTPVVEKLKSSPDGPDLTNTYDCVIPILGHTILSVKQFEKYYWPSFKKVLDVCQEKNKQVYFFAEGSWLRFADFFNDYKKGVINMMVEQDNPYEVRKRCPNICISGGLDVDVMGRGTPAQCVDMAKKAIDELGANGGLILQENKMVSFEYDNKSENIKAVADFVSNYYL